jgi:hypothetical protein
MIQATARPSPSPRDAGFALVGIIIFLLTLTVLGLSLFSLSAFEAQLAIRSQHEAAAFHAAVGGLERAKFALLKRDSLSAVKRNLPIQGVTYARAMQGTDSIGAIRWFADSVVTIRVLGVDGPARKLIEARFQPKPGVRLYKHLYTTSGGVTVRNTRAWPDSLSRWAHTLLVGNVWQNSADTSWSWKTGGSHAVHRIGGVPPPDLTEFFNAYWGGASGPVSPGNSHNYELPADKNCSHCWEFFKTPYDPTRVSPYGGSLNGYSLDDTARKVGSGTNFPQANVSGKSVWMFDQGVRFREQLLVHATSAQDTPVVVIVAKKGHDPDNPNVGIWFRGAIDAKQGQYCAVMLVTDGKVIIEHDVGTVDHSFMPYLAVYAADIQVIGPPPDNKKADNYLEHDHTLTAGEDSDNGAVDHIAELGLLPNVAKSKGGFTFIPNSWREIASSSGN